MDITTRSAEPSGALQVSEATQWPIGTQIPDDYYRVAELKRYGSTSGFYSGPFFDPAMGSGEYLLIHVIVNEASSNPTLTVVAEEPIEAENWTSVALFERIQPKVQAERVSSIRSGNRDPQSVTNANILGKSGAKTMTEASRQHPCPNNQSFAAIDINLTTGRA